MRNTRKTSHSQSLSIEEEQVGGNKWVQTHKKEQRHLDTGETQEGNWAISGVNHDRHWGRLLLWVKGDEGGGLVRKEGGEAGKGE